MAYGYELFAEICPAIEKVVGLDALHHSISLHLFALFSNETSIKVVETRYARESSLLSFGLDRV